MLRRESIRIPAGIAALVVGASLLTASGCGPSRPRGPEFNKALDTDTVVMHGFSETTKLSRQNEWVETVNGFLKPHLVMRNNTGNMLFLEFRTYFRDANGATLETPSDMWEPVSVNPREDYHYSKMSTNKKAESYQVHIRLAK